MSEADSLQKAYRTLNLEPGASFEAVIRRHKRLIMVWHPDRFSNPQSKLDAEEESAE